MTTQICVQCRDGGYINVIFLKNWIMNVVNFLFVNMTGEMWNISGWRPLMPQNVILKYREIWFGRVIPSVRHTGRGHGEWWGLKHSASHYNFFNFHFVIECRVGNSSKHHLLETAKQCHLVYMYGLRHKVESKLFSFILFDKYILYNYYLKLNIPINYIYCQQMIYFFVVLTVCCVLNIFKHAQYHIYLLLLFFFFIFFLWFVGYFLFVLLHCNLYRQNNTINGPYIK